MAMGHAFTAATEAHIRSGTIEITFTEPFTTQAAAQAFLSAQGIGVPEGAEVTYMTCDKNHGTGETRVHFCWRLSETHPATTPAEPRHCEGCGNDDGPMRCPGVPATP